MGIKQLSVGYGSCSLTFASESDKSDFINTEPILLPEGLSCCVNLFDDFVERKMPESCLPVQDGQALNRVS